MMNAILQANMAAIMNQIPRHPKPECGVRLRSNSKSKQIIVYLLENGKTSGTDLMNAIGLASSPQSYIQPHLRAGRVICDSVHIHKAMYSINVALTRKDFGLSERKND